MNQTRRGFLKMLGAALVAAPFLGRTKPSPFVEPQQDFGVWRITLPRTYPGEFNEVWAQHFAFVNGKREDLSDFLTVLEPEDNPVASYHWSMHSATPHYQVSTGPSGECNIHDIANGNIYKGGQLVYSRGKP